MCIFRGEETCKSQRPIGGLEKRLENRQGERRDLGIVADLAQDMLRQRRAQEAMRQVQSQNALLPKGNQAIQIQCAAANLDFKSGRASGKNLVGARSDVSQLLTSRHVDFRDESIDLRGNVYARSGVRLGLASIASDVQIAGKLAKPTMQLDPNATPAVLARAGAAIASAGATLIGGALVDALETKERPLREGVPKAIQFCCSEITSSFTRG